MKNYLPADIYAAKQGGAGDVLHDTTTVLAEVIEVEKGIVEIGYTDPQNIRRYIKVSLSKLVSIAMHFGEAP